MNSTACLRRRAVDTMHASWPRVLTWPQQGLMLLVRGYRLLLKPWLGNACRFEPTCSAYTLEALQRHGALNGSALGVWRLLRCHPWCDGGHDPVPENLSGLFTHLMSSPSRSSAPIAVSAADSPTRLSLTTHVPLADQPAAPSPTRNTP